jgi:Rps23 Pro-64 3,4-dihydroxylase Tpa1-like proline 4-hydroxylase
MSIFSQTELNSIAKSCADKIIKTKLDANYFETPYKHLVIDDFFDKRLADLCLANFPLLEDASWEHANDEDIEIKYRTTWKSEFDIPEGIVDAVRILNSSLFLKAMSIRFGIDKIVSDPYFTGGGLNITKTGGLLDVHVDGNYHDATGLNRRLNALVYMNPNWQPAWGGEFGVYDENGDKCLKKIAPLFNRLVIFDSHDKSFHGLPAPLKFPESETRKSIILYYYTKESRPDSQISVEKPHSALWKKRNLLDKRGNKTRDYS